MADQFQYIQLPDGSYGKFRGDASDEDIRAAISKDFPDAFKPADKRNVIQRGFDTAQDYLLKPHVSPMATAAGHFAAGGLDTVRPFIHPLDTIHAIGEHPLQSAYGLTGPGAVEGLLKGAVNDPARAAGQLGVGALEGEVGGALTRGIGTGLRSAGAGLDNAILGTPITATERGANPGLALSENRMVGSTPNALLRQVKEQVPVASAEHRASIAANTRPNQLINSGPLVSDPFDLEIGKGTNPQTGAVFPSQVSRARLTQRTLTHVPDLETGRPTANMRNPFLTPLQANDLKSSIYGMTNYDDPFRSSVANSGLKGAAHGLKSAIETEVPESLESGQRLHNLMAAKDVLIPQAQGTALVPASRAGLMERAGTLAGTGTASLLDLAGAGAHHLVPVARIAPYLSEEEQQ